MLTLLSKIYNIVVQFFEVWCEMPVVACGCLHLVEVFFTVSAKNTSNIQKWRSEFSICSP